MAFVYILKSLKTGQYYIGSTQDYSRRIEEHNKGLSFSTKPLRPLEIMLVQEFSTLSEARKVEFRLKRLKRRDYIEKIIKEGKVKKGA